MLFPVVVDIIPQRLMRTVRESQVIELTRSVDELAFKRFIQDFLGGSLSHGLGDVCKHAADKLMLRDRSIHRWDRAI